MDPREAPPWQIAAWLNADAPLTLAALRGRVVLLHGFQLHCPGCVRFGLPQAQRVHELFPPGEVAVVGLHAVFEGHDEATPEALAVFVRARGLTFPIGVDEPDPAGGPLPLTMRAYAMQGTPTTVLIDRKGRRRAQLLGPHEDLRLGAALGALLAEAPAHDAGG
jgi:thiol-disulfide isomerase/thioredoxin